MIEHKDKHGNENMIEGRNAVLEAFRSGKPVDKLFVLDGCQDGPVRTIVREAKKHDTLVQFVDKERLTQLSQTGRHQGVIAYTCLLYTSFHNFSFSRIFCVFALILCRALSTVFGLLSKSLAIVR